MSFSFLERTQVSENWKMSTFLSFSRARSHRKWHWCPELWDSLFRAFLGDGVAKNFVPVPEWQ